MHCDSIGNAALNASNATARRDQPGVVVRLLVPSGATVEVGAPIAVLADPGETVGDVDALLGQLGVTAEAAPPDPEGAPDQPLSPVLPAPPAPAATGNGHGRIFASPHMRS